jgi:glycosyltransferase involved in cell wall biosynthesis
MVRVLHTIDTTGPGGAETVFVNLARFTNTDGFESIAAVSGPGWLRDELGRLGIQTITIQNRGSFHLKYLWELIRTIRALGIDVVQSHLLGSNMYCSVAGALCRVPVISTFHGFVDTASGERLLALKRSLINQGSQRIVFVSDHLRRYFLEQYRFSPEKSMTIYNGVDTSVFRPRQDDSIRKELGLGKEQVLIGSVGNIRPAKGYDLFLRAARRIHDAHPEARFVLAGEGSGRLYQELLQLREELGLEDVFHFMGFQQEAASVFNNLDIFVLPSRSEGFSISTIEAMACGVPVVVTRSGGPEEIVEDGENGIAVECDSEDIARGVMRLIGDPELKASVRDKALGEVAQKFSLRAMVDQYRLFYDQTNVSGVDRG